MNMIGHDHEFVELKDPAFAIAEHGKETGSPTSQRLRRIFDLKNRPWRLKPPPVMTRFARLEAVRFHGTFNINTERNGEEKM
jgi:hypothetical protein